MKKSMIMSAAVLLCMVVAMVSCNNKEDYPYKTDYLPVQLAGSEKWSILDINSGELLVKDAYTQAPSPVVDGMYYVMNDDGSYNYYNVANPKTPVNKKPFGSVTVFSEDGMAVASYRGEALCVINKNCEIVKELPKDVSQCSMFSHGMAAYQNDMGKWGYIDTKGDTVIPAKYETANLFMSEDVAIVVDEKMVNDTTVSYSVIDKKGNVLFSHSNTEYSLIQPYFVSGVLPVVKNTEAGDTVVCLDKRGEETANPNKGDHEAVDKAEYKDYSRTPAGTFIVMNKDNKMGVVDKSNNVMIEIKHERITDVRKDRYIVGQDTIFSLVDEKGAAVGNVKFVHAHGGSESMFATRGFIDTNLAAASMLMMFDIDNCVGATPTTTLMDMNSILNPNPASSVDQNGIAMPQGPFIVRYMFDKPMASMGEGGPSYNLDAKVVVVDISFSAVNLSLNTEEEITDKISGSMGTKGFVLGEDGMFHNEDGQTVSIGYRKGILSLCYYFDKSLAKALPREPRK